MISLKTYILETQNNISLNENDDSKDDSKLRADIKFKIWKSPDNFVTSLKDNEDYQKIEYVFKEKESGIVIDFLIGKKDGTWQLWIGKDGAVSYDDDPFYNLEEISFLPALSKAVDKVIDFIDEVKSDPNNWVQYYIHR